MGFLRGVFGWMGGIQVEGLVRLGDFPPMGVASTHHIFSHTFFVQYNKMHLVAFEVLYPCDVLFLCNGIFGRTSRLVGFSTLQSYHSHDSFFRGFFLQNSTCLNAIYAIYVIFLVFLDKP